MRRVACLLRAVNVGGRQLLMADLKRIAQDMGFHAPQTLLASGNLILGTTLTDAVTAERLAAALLGETGLTTDVLIRDAAQLHEVAAANPFRREAEEAPSRLVAMFLSANPPADLDLLASACGGGEQVRAGPQCLYIHYPAGAGTSKLTNALIERRLALRGTARNWNTVGKLVTQLATGGGE